MAPLEGLAQANECGMLVSCCRDRYCASCAHATFRAMTSIFSPSPSLATPAIFSSTWIPRPMSCHECWPMAMSLVSCSRPAPAIFRPGFASAPHLWKAAVISKHLAHTYGGDLASTGSSHLGRLAGFTNQKPQRRRLTGHAPWVRIVEARGVLASAAQDLLRCATQVVTQLPTDTLNRLSPADNPSSTITVQGATRIYQRWMQHWHIRERFAQPDWSIVDLWLARKLLAMHISTTQVETILRLGSPLFPRQHGDPENYVRRTLARAALPPPRTVCSSHATAPLTPDEETDKDFSNSRGGR